jgi:hypothetical protein
MGEAIDAQNEVWIQGMSLRTPQWRWSMSLCVIGCRGVSLQMLGWRWSMCRHVHVIGCHRISGSGCDSLCICGHHWCYGWCRCQGEVQRIGCRSMSVPAESPQHFCHVASECW